MLRWTTIAMLALATAASAADSGRRSTPPSLVLYAAEPGRTDGPEGSEYGRGGYGRFRSEGQLYVEGHLGSATVSTEYENGLETEETDLFTGLYVGYQIENWLGFQVGYARIANQDAHLLSAGTRSVFDASPFAYYLAIDAEIYAPTTGDSYFALAPGIGAEVGLNDRLHVGLHLQRDIIFADDSIDVNRLSAKVRFDF